MSDFVNVRILIGNFWDLIFKKILCFRESLYLFILESSVQFLILFKLKTLQYLNQFSLIFRANIL